MRVVSIVGARPQFIKVAPISWRAGNSCEHLILHTGQHYDPELSSNFFSELEIPEPVANLYSGSGNHGAQTARILAGVEESLLSLKPDWVLVYGDTNSTIAGTLAATKLGIKVGHVEAGLRSFNRGMPEEINRIGADHLSDLLFTPTAEAMVNLQKEGLSAKSLLVGDVMLETLMRVKEKIGSNISERKERIFATIHRAENTDLKKRLTFIISQLAKSTIPVNLYAHPRLVHKAEEFGINLAQGAITVKTPATYFETVKGIIESVGVITDSGGLQKEAYLLERPCLTVRHETEWVETLVGKWNQLDPELAQVNKKWWSDSRPSINLDIYGEQNASKKILDALANYPG
jgi:UDP-N-acetylglucosamine 2-epimerase (non-hydrolysing)